MCVCVCVCVCVCAQPVCFSLPPPRRFPPFLPPSLANPRSLVHPHTLARARVREAAYASRGKTVDLRRSRPGKALTKREKLDKHLRWNPFKFLHKDLFKDGDVRRWSAEGCEAQGQEPPRDFP